MNVQTELILYALVAAGLVFWLRSVLGTRHGEERERPNPFTQDPKDDEGLSVKKTEERFSPSIFSVEGQDVLDDNRGQGIQSPIGFVLPSNVRIPTDDVRLGLENILRIDHSFNPAIFAQNAQDAFVMVVEAFSKGDKTTLADLLSPHVYKVFEAALQDRLARREQVETQIHAIRETIFEAARLENETAYITLRFIADESYVVRDFQGTVLSGDPDRIAVMNDIWTFTRILTSGDPRWMVCETKDGDVSEDHALVPGA